MKKKRKKLLKNIEKILQQSIANIDAELAKERGKGFYNIYLEMEKRMRLQMLEKIKEMVEK
jgi:ribosome maturation factor RimP